MKLHILGICGTFMGGIARLAQQLGHQVSGSDQNVYPPMSVELARLNIEINKGYEPAWLDPRPDLVIVGNALSRGNESIEHVLSEKIPYISGPQWLAENILMQRDVLAVSGTHGKTTTSSILAWILHSAGKEPGFLIGGVPENFKRSAELGKSNLFVIEADEYDTAFFDKRSKFIHYHPDVLIINNIEYDHADIFSDMPAIQKQFHHLLRIIPPNGQIIVRDGNPHIETVLEMGSWSPVTRFGDEASAWHTATLNHDYSEFQVIRDGREAGRVNWSLFGGHNAENALAAIIAARRVGVSPQQACESLAGFQSVKRRLQLLASVNGVSVYDDFAHHPTAIARSLSALRNRVGGQRLIVVLELRSNTMKSGVHRETLAESLAAADLACVLEPPAIDWDLRAALGSLGDKSQVFDNIEGLMTRLVETAARHDHIVIMSNGGFENIHERLIKRLRG